MTVRQQIQMPGFDREKWAPEWRAEHDSIAHPEPEYCQHNCDGNPEDHPVTWRIYPHPNPGPIEDDGVITELIRCCTCCAWSCGGEGFVDRLQRESFEGRDIRIERLVEGHWTNFEARF